MGDACIHFGRAHGAIWKRTGLVVCLMAGLILVLVLLLGPVVYVVRVGVKGCRREYRVFREWMA